MSRGSLSAAVTPALVPHDTTASARRPPASAARRVPRGRRAKGRARPSTIVRGVNTEPMVLGRRFGATAPVASKHADGSSLDAAARHRPGRRRSTEPRLLPAGLVLRPPLPPIDRAVPGVDRGRRGGRPQPTVAVPLDPRHRYPRGEPRPHQPARRLHRARRAHRCRAGHRAALVLGPYRRGADLRLAASRSSTRCSGCRSRSTRGRRPVH